MKKTLILPAAIALALLPAQGATPSLEGLAEYCYPANKAASPETLTWLPDETAYALLSADGQRVETFDPATGEKRETLFDCATTREGRLDAIEGFTLSPDGRRLLVWHGREAVYRRSFTAEYWVYEVRSRLLVPLSKEGGRQRAPLFSPDGRMVAFVDASNNLRLRKLDYDTEVAVTTDGTPGRVINGVPDWTYEEEFFTTQSMAWAPDALTLCWLRYDETAVPEYTFTRYATPCDGPDAADALYPPTFSYKYPTAGKPNSTVTLHSYDVETRKTKDLPLPEGYEYVVRIAYNGVSSADLYAATLNRDQTALTVARVSPRAATCAAVYTDRAQTGWIEPMAYTAMAFTPDFFVTSSDRSGWNQLYRVSYAGAVEQALTPDGQDATDYYGYDAAHGRHWWQTTGGDPLNRVVGYTDKNGAAKTASAAEGTASAVFSPSMKWAVACHSSVSRPPMYTLVDGNSYKAKRTLEDNAALAARYASAPRPEFFTIPASAEGPALNGYVMRGPGADGRTVLYQYSGPGSQEVRNRWWIDWMHYYAQQGYTVVCVDGRGTGARGRDFRTAVYRNLGHYETIDQLRAARYAASLPGVDPARIGICGWSYGGYETLMAVTEAGNPFKAAVAIAPVTDWRYYDTVYAERYMLTPGQNEAGYRASAPVNRVNSLSDACSLLLMHGTSDDNVHLANTLDFTARLIDGGRYADMLLFPGMNHSINGCNTRAMVYWRMMSHFNAHL